MSSIALVVALAAQSSQSLGLMNQQMADTWSAVMPVAQQAIQQAVAGLPGAQYGILTVQQAQLLELNLNSAPKVVKLQPHHIYLKLPNGGWVVKVKIKLKANLGWFTTSFWVTAKLSNLQLKFQAWMQLLDPFRPKIVAVWPQLSFNLSLSSTNFLANAILWIVQNVLGSSLTQGLANFVATVYLSYLTFGAPGPIFAEGSPFLYLSPAADLGGIAAEMRAAVMANHLPHGTVVDAMYSNSNGSLWGWSRHGDSAIYTGHMLAGQALAYAQTGSPEAQAMGLALLGGIKRLLDVGSSPTYKIGTQPFVGYALPPNARGRLVRYAARPGDPYQGSQTFGAYYEAKSQASGKPLAYATLNGEVWYGHPTTISRDQYIGVVRGLAMAHVHFDSPAAKALAKESMTRIMNYLLFKGWILDTPAGAMSTSYAGTPTQVAAISLAARQVDPAAFGAAAQLYGSMADLGWAGAWLETFDPHGSYFKFDLMHTALQLAMYLETNPGRWLWHWYAMRILHRAIGHHQNPYFSALYALEQPWLAGQFAAGVQEGLEQYVARPRNPTPLAVITPEAMAYLAALPTTVNEPIVPFSLSMGGEIDAEESEVIATQVVPLLYRPPRAYLWGRSPFSLGPTPTGGGATINHYPGADYQIGYWLARHAGVVN